MRLRQQEIISELGVQRFIDPEQEITERTQFLSRYLGESGLHGYVLGISGGQDSLLAGILAQRAVESLRANGTPAEFHAVLLPYGEQRDRQDALDALDSIKPDHIHDLNIKPTTDAYVNEFIASEGSELPDFHKGNVKARMRMIAQYALAGVHNALVIGTDHAAEAVTGFYTKYGDGGADIMPLSGLTKRQGRTILQHLQVPERFTTKPPTADLLDKAPGQPDETELGLTYDEIDDYLEGYPVNPRIAEHIERQFNATQHKRCMPVGYSRPL